MLTAILFVATAAMELPEVSDKPPVDFPHFPTPVHTFVWRNWTLVSTERMAEVLDTSEENVLRVGSAMGLPAPEPIDPQIRQRAYITIIRRNWHLLPYEQLTTLLGMTEDELAFTLREDDFLYIKLGRMKPNCPVLRYEEPTDEVLEREFWIKEEAKIYFPEERGHDDEPLFQFVEDLSTPPAGPIEAPESQFSPRYCSSYFQLFGDPLLDESVDPYPPGFLDRLVASGVNGLWMHVVLYQLAPYPWDSDLSEGYEKRLDRLRELSDRLDDHGIGLYLYMNEPRAMPLSFFEKHPDLKGVVEGDHAAMCTSNEVVRDYIADSIAMISDAAPNIRGFFTITASENLTSCWSHHNGGACVRCKERSPADVIAEVNATIWEGIQRADNGHELIAWDWGWRDDWAIDAINKLPDGIALQSVSEWSIPINRGVETAVGEYSISVIGPGPRATKHWAAARARGLKTIAKIQAGNTWELAAVPYIPAVNNVAQHAANLREANVDGIMLGWSLGGYPSPNLAVVAEMASSDTVNPRDALLKVARDRYGREHADAVAEAWTLCSEGFSEFPYHGSVVYRAPLQVGPANLLWSSPTDYASSMVGIPYDDLSGWRGPYPAEVFIDQMKKVEKGFADAYDHLHASVGVGAPPILRPELGVIRAAELHFGSVADQARFVHVRDTMLKTNPAAAIDILKEIIETERNRASRLKQIQRNDSRIGYESSNHYFYIPQDLIEKQVNCSYLLNHWIPQLEDALDGQP